MPTGRYKVVVSVDDRRNTPLLQTAALEFRAGLVVRLEIQGVVGDESEEQLPGVDPHPAEHTAGANRRDAPAELVEREGPEAGAHAHGAESGTASTASISSSSSGRASAETGMSVFAGGCAASKCRARISRSAGRFLRSVR